MKIIEQAETAELFSKNEGPFIPSLRVACPLKRFSRRKTEKCISCDHFHGILKREVTGQQENANPIFGSKVFSIVCNHPVSRSLEYCCED